MTADLLAQRTLELIRIQSPSGREGKAADHVEAFLRDHTAPVRLIRHGNAVVAAFGFDPAAGVPDDSVVLGGHLDTVPQAGQAEPGIRGDEVVGLGTTDMKGALAVMLTLAERYPATGATPVALVFYDNEEASYEVNGLGPLLEAEPWLGTAGIALMLEPTDNVLEVGCLGAINATVTFHGIAAHSARPWLGKNAIHEAGAFLVELAAREPRDYREGSAVYREVINATRARGGEARNVIPDHFTLNLNYRFPPDRTPAAAEAFLRSLIPEGADVEIVDLAPAASPRMDAPALRRLVEDHGLEVRAKQAWTDVARFGALGVPAANFGPGIPELAHRIDEKVPIENLARNHAVLAAFLGIEEGA